jgi:hypothetical protein
MNYAVRILLPSLSVFLILFSYSWGDVTETVILEGKKINIYFYPGAKVPNPPGQAVFFAPGDGGWRGFAITIAESLSSWGCDTYGMDKKDYLELLVNRKTDKPTDVMHDYHTIGLWIQKGSQEPVTIIGWSEGAGLGILAASSEENRGIYDGLVTLGLGDSNILGWRKADYITYLTHKEPDEPKFLASDYISKVSPLPFFMIVSEADEYVPHDESLKLFAQAQEPKKFILIEKARNHQFDGNTAGFFKELRNGLLWIKLKR